MAFNGSGTFVRDNGTNTGSTVWADDRDAGTKILAANHDAHDQDIATALSSCMVKDGQQTPTANLPMGGYRHSGVGNATAQDQYLSMSQFMRQDGVYCGTSGGSGGAYTITSGFSLTTYISQAGLRFIFIANHTNTGGTNTLAVDGLSARSLYAQGANALSAGEVQAGDILDVIYDGTQFIIFNKIVRGTSDEIVVTQNSGLVEVSLPDDVVIGTTLTAPTLIASTALQTDTISEKTSAAGVTIDGVKLKDSFVYTDRIAEKTSAAGVTADNVLLKDDAVYADNYYNHGTHIGLGTTSAHNVYMKINGADQVLLTNGTLEPNVDNDITLGTSTKAYQSVHSYGIQSNGSNDLTVLAPSGQDVVINSNGTGSPSKLTFGWNGRLNFAPSAAYGTSAKTVGTDAPADWLEIQIAGTTYYIPCYAA